MRRAQTDRPAVEHFFDGIVRQLFRSPVCLLRLQVVGLPRPQSVAVKMFRFFLRLLLRLPTKKRLVLTGLRCRLCSVFAGVETRGVAAEAGVEPPLAPRSTVMFFACLLLVFPDEFFGVPAKCMQSLIALFRGWRTGGRVRYWARTSKGRDYAGSPTRRPPQAGAGRPCAPYSRPTAAAASDFQIRRFK